MSALREKLLALAHSEITATFQRVCGIRSHSVNSSPKCNSFNGKIDDNAAGSVNGAASMSINNNANGHDLLTIPQVNGHLIHQCNGVSHTRPILNGVLTKRSNVPHRNGYTKLIENDLASPGSLGTDNASDKHECSNGHDDKHEVGQVTGQADSERATSYTIENNLLYYLFSFGASLGNEIFYILFFTSTLWNFDSFVVRKMLILWCVTMYIGQAAKDIIRLPRPTSPPVVRLEERYELEYGMPSTHAMVGVAIPFGMLLYMSGRYEFNFTFGLVLATAWSILVSFSRLYLGMHSLLDITAGLLFAIILMTATYPFVDSVDQFLISHSSALPVMVAVCIFLCLMYPPIDKWSTARGDTTQVLAVFSGIYAGMWLTGRFTSFQPQPDSPPYNLGLPSGSVLSLILLRQSIGVVIVVAVLTLLKWVVLHILSWYFQLNPKDPLTKQHLFIEFPYKFICYSLAAVSSTYVMPLLFLRLNIERPSYYSEILNPSVM